MHSTVRLKLGMKFISRGHVANASGGIPVPQEMAGSSQGGAKIPTSPNGC